MLVLLRTLIILHQDQHEILYMPQIVDILVDCGVGPRQSLAVTVDRFPVFASRPMLEHFGLSVRNGDRSQWAATADP